MKYLSRILMVEDKDDSYVATALLNSIGTKVRTKDPMRGRTGLLEFEGEGESCVGLRLYVAHGKDDLLKQLPVESRAADLDTLAVIIDANGDMASRWNEVKYRLENIGCANVPPGLPKEGLALEVPDGPRVGVWIMPNNSLPGMLEDFLISLIRDDDKLLPHATQFVDGIPEATRASSCRSKSIFRVWLALQEKPERTFGQTIDAGLLDLSKPECQQHVSWLRRLLVEKRPEPPLDVNKTQES